MCVWVFNAFMNEIKLFISTGKIRHLNELVKCLREKNLLKRNKMISLLLSRKENYGNVIYVEDLK